jgi:hypothetical protein
MHAGALQRKLLLFTSMESESKDEGRTMDHF